MPFYIEYDFSFNMEGIIPGRRIDFALIFMKITQETVPKLGTGMGNGQKRGSDFRIHLNRIIEKGQKITQKVVPKS